MLEAYETPVAERAEEVRAGVAAEPAPADVRGRPAAGAANGRAGIAAPGVRPSDRRVAPGTAAIAAPSGVRPSDRRVALGTAGIAAAMAAVAALMCTGVPFAALYLASLAPAGGQPAAGALVFMAAMAAGVAPCWLLLAALQGRHCRLTGGRVHRSRRGWQRSSSDGDGRRASTLLEVVMTWSVILAAIAMGVWYFGFADAYPILRR